MVLINAETTNEEQASQMLAEIPDTYQKSVGFFAWDFCRAVAIAILNLWDKLLYISGLDDLTNFAYDDLVRFVLQRRGIVALTATYASGLLTVAGGSGTVTIGDLFATPDGLQFEATETKSVIEDDTFSVQCLTAGTQGNVPTGSITVMPVTISGITAVTNLDAMTGGYEAESKESLISRYLDDLQKPVTSGNKYFYEKYAKEIAGVGKVDIKPLWDGDNTVKVIIIDTDYEPADAELVADVQEYIDPDSNGKGEGKAPVGAYCTVASATALDLTITANIVLKSGETIDTVQNNVEAKIKEYLQSIAFVEDYVSYAQIGAMILASDGVNDYDTLLINGGIDNISVDNTDTDRAVPVLYLLTLTEV